MMIIMMIKMMMMTTKIARRCQYRWCVCPRGGSGSQDLQVSPPSWNNRCVSGVIVSYSLEKYFGDDISTPSWNNWCVSGTIGTIGDDISPPNWKNRCGFGVIVK